MLSELLSIRKIRQDRAQKRVAAQRQVLKNAWLELEQAKTQLDDYHSWRLQKEDDLFYEAKEKTLILKELELFQQKIALMRQEEAEKAQTVKSLEHQHHQEKDKLNQYERHLHAASKNVEKFTYIFRQHQAEHKAQQHYQEELEQEEFTHKPMDTLDSHYGQ